MKQITMFKIVLFASVIFVISFSSINNTVFADDISDTEILYNQANKHLLNGELHEAIELYDEILNISPNNIDAMIMKGISLGNLERHKQSMKEFYNVLEQEPQNIQALLGMGVGFGNYGEYKEAYKYFESAHVLNPENHVINNYKHFAKNVIDKYPYNEVEKPEIFTIDVVEQIPEWIKNNAGWWADGQIDDLSFISGIQFLIKNDIIQLDTTKVQNNKSDEVPEWIKNNAGWWADGQIDDAEFLTSMHFLIKNGIIVIEISDTIQLTEEETKIADRNEWQFFRYLDRIEKRVYDDKRYIEYPNPSNDVIKKFLRDYVKWNFEQQLQIGNKNFPNPEYFLIDGIYHLEYKIYVNDQPNGLPLDHVGTLTNSFRYWEAEEFNANDGKVVKIHFVTTKSKADANLWVTWVVRNIGENVLGHANIGKGVVEVALGSYGCDGNFQLFHVDTVETIMTHELGHGIGLKHTSDIDSIMYPTIKKTTYAYCMLDVMN
jgi:tetratricopeptide (TPR) repeat protein